MDAQWQEAPFVEFGDNPFSPYERPELPRIASDSTDTLRRLVRNSLPKTPGVYGMIDLAGRLVYVGKSKSLRSRVLSYFLPHNEEDKAGRIVQSAATIVWEEHPTEFAALLREQQLIRLWQPRFNTQGIPRRQRPVHICLGRGPAEQLYTSRSSDPKALTCVGPFQGASRAARAVEVLNRVFKLRDCSSAQRFSFSDQLQLFDIAPRPGCIRYEIQSCLGPCTFGCTRSAYDSQVGSAADFLIGVDTSAVDQLEEQMNKAAERQHFEQAARLREDLTAVRWLARRVTDLAVARKDFTFVYQPPAVSGPAVWYLIRRGVIEGVLAEPKGKREVQKTETVIRRWIESDNHVGHRFTPRPETLALVSSWFRNQRSEFQNTKRPASPLSLDNPPKKKAKVRADRSE